VHKKESPGTFSKFTSLHFKKAKSHTLSTSAFCFIACLVTMSGLTINPGGVQFNPDTDIPDLAGKIILVTGGVFVPSARQSNPVLTKTGTAGIGKTTILSLCAHNPRHIVFTGRNRTRANEVISEASKISPNVPLTFLECDQSSLKSVETAAKGFLAAFDRLDILFANAGVMALPPGLSEDGYEIQFATNHLSHALLLKYLLPLMLRTASAGRDVRLVTTTSSAFQGSYGIVYDTLKTTQESFFGHFRRYMQSKLANTLYAAKIAELYPGIVSCSVQPGAVATDIGSGNLGVLGELFKVIGTRGRSLTPEQGAWNMCWVATTARENLVNGAYYEPVGWKGSLTKVAQDQAARDGLWEWTREELSGYEA
jgi:NAD(P)-dependent dehydrogenase (short-subunit alcohol dehydrogenase family)